MALPPEYVYHISTRINSQMRDIAKLEDCVDAASFVGDARAIVEAAKCHGFIIHSASSDEPSVYIIGFTHGHVPPASLSLTPSGAFLADLLDRSLLTGRDAMLVEGVPVGQKVDEAFYGHDEWSVKSYLAMNRGRMARKAVFPAGADDLSLLGEQKRLFRRSIEEDRKGDADASWAYQVKATEKIIERDMLYAAAIPDRRTFLFMGNAHVFAGIMQAKLEEAGRPYVTLVQKGGNR